MKAAKLLFLLTLCLLTFSWACTSSSDGDNDTTACVDADNDGYTAESCGGDDCDDSNSLIHPGATDIDGDGVDADCDGTDAQGEPPVDDDDDDNDTEMPTIVSLVAQVQSVTTVNVELAEDEVKEKIIPSQAQVTFTTRAEDNQTDEENLVLAVIDTTGGGSAEVTLLSNEFQSGLWSVSFTAELGHEYVLTVTDEADNLFQYSGSLYFLTRAEAITDDWSIHYFLENTNSKFMYEAAFASNGTFTEEKSNSTTDYRSGSWSLNGTEIEYAWEEASGVEVTSSDPVPGVDYKVNAEVYVDSLYMAIAPWTKSTAGTDLDNTTWERDLEYYRVTAAGTDWYLAEDRHETWTLGTRSASNIGDWDEAVTGTEYNEAGDNLGPISDTRSGTWQVIVNQDYVNSMDDFLKIEITSVNGVGQATETLVDLHTTRSNLLLVRPFIRE
jgi:Putative metal-binding motif